MLTLTRPSLARCPPIPLLSRGAKRKLPKKGALIRLLQDIPMVGKAGAIMEVPRSMMRAYYFPDQQAEYILRPQGGFRPGDLLSKSSQEAEEQELSTLPTVLAESALRTPSLTVLLPLLQALPPLTFTRRPIAPSAPQIFGSVTAANVLQRLAQEHNITLDGSACSVHITGPYVELNRIKGLGENTVRISLPGAGEAEIRVRVVPDQQEEAALAA